MNSNKIYQECKREKSEKEYIKQKRNYNIKNGRYKIILKQLMLYLRKMKKEMYVKMKEIQERMKKRNIES